MTPGFIALTTTLAILQVVLPQRLAFLPLLIAACHLGDNELVSELTPVRLLVVIGLVRAAATGVFRWSAQNKIDLLFLVFSVVAILVSAVPREDIPSAFRQNIGLVLNVFGTYLYGRAYLAGPDAVQTFARCLAIVIIPFAFFMTVELSTRYNAYSKLGAIHEYSIMRDGKIRAAGPFGHPILAGTVGAVSLPFMALLWRTNRKKAKIGFACCALIAISSNSSGPLAASMAAVLCLSLWKWRYKITTIHKWIWIIAPILHLISTRGIWYLMARIDLTGGSTGYHRAKLIDNALADLGSWWLAGTDYTRHWMHSGVSWSNLHTDITNYYLHLGVIGGLGLTLSFMGVIYLCFLRIGRLMKATDYVPSSNNLARWIVGSSIFTHALSMLSISYFDQMYAFFYLTIGMAANLAIQQEEAEEPAVQPRAESAAGQRAYS